MRLGKLGVVLFWCASALAQGPVIFDGGIVNAASSAKGQVVTAGSLVSIYGSDLASGTVAAQTIPLQTELGGVTVTFNGIAAPLTLVSAGQINAQVPVNVLPGGLTEGPATVIVTRSGVSSAPKVVQVGPFSPGLFSVNFGVGQAIAINADSTLAAPAGSIPGLTTHPAKIDDTIILLGTGLGAVNPPVESGRDSLDALRVNTTLPTALIGGLATQVQFSGLSPQFVGVNQINVKIPAGAPTGDSVPLQLRQGTITSSDQVTIAIAGNAVTGQIALRGTIGLSNRPNSLALSGNIAYACTAEDIDIVNITDPSNLSLSNIFAGSQFNAANNIQCRIRNNRLLVVNDTGNTQVTGTVPSITIFDLANQTNPTQVSATITNKKFNGPPVLQGDFLLVPTNAISFTNVIVGQSGDVYSLNLANPSTPVVAGTMFRAPDFTVDPQFGGPYVVFGLSRVNENTMLVGTTTSKGGDTSIGVARLIVLDTTNPAQPAITGEVQIPGTRIAVAPVVDGTMAVGYSYVEGWRNPVNFSQGALVGPLMLYVLDLTNPRTPTIVKTVFTPLMPSDRQGGVSLGGGHFLLFGARGAIISVDASNPQNPQYETIDVSAQVMDMVRAGNLLYVLFEDNRMAVYDIK